jgi:hypothetical protein
MAGRPKLERSPKARRTGPVSCGHVVRQNERIYKPRGAKGFICQECRRRLPPLQPEPG